MDDSPQGAAPFDVLAHQKVYNKGSAAADAVSLVIIDDQPLFRAGVRAALSTTDPHIEIVGEAADGHEALTLIAALAPAVLLLNAEVEGLNGLQAIRDILRASANIAVVLMTTVLDEEKLFYAIKSGAAAYVAKSIGIDELCGILHRVAHGAYLINDTVLAKPALAASVLRSFRSLAEDQDSQGLALYTPLTARETQVLDFIAKGNTNKAVAGALHISDQTVKNHVTSIMRKLAVNDRTQAVVYALRQGWISA